MLNIKELGKKTEPIRIIWLHGWGHDNTAFAQIAPSFASSAENYLVDLPGFGGSKKPKKVWGTEEYAKNVLSWMKTLKKDKPTYVVGHSFGGKVAMKMAELAPEKITGIILVSSAGLRIKKSLKTKIKVLISRLGAPIFKKFQRFLPGIIKTYLISMMGSEDYKNSRGVMRSIMVKTVNEDFSDLASKLNTKTLLVYGSDDIHTPPLFGKKFNSLIKNSKFVELKGYNHYTILTNGKYQLQNLIEKFLKEDN